MITLYLITFSFCFDLGFLYVVQVVLKFEIVLAQPPESWECRHCHALHEASFVLPLLAYLVYAVSLRHHHCNCCKDKRSEVCKA